LNSRPEDHLARRGGAVELLRVASGLFGAAVRVRRFAYDHDLAPSTRVPVPVVSVGNLTTGGTGKTPMCAWIVRELERRGRRPGILSRGYRAHAAVSNDEGLNDEGLMLARSCPGVPNVADAERVRGARKLVGLGANAIVLDDGFQHRRLARDLDIVLVDATRPWGLASVDGREPVRALLPRGLLREPPSSLARADLIVITRCDLVDEPRLAALERDLGYFAPGRPLVRARHAPRVLRDERGHEASLESLRGRAVDLVSALGNPAAFEATVRGCGAIVASHHAFPDHHAFTPRDIEGLPAQSRTLVVSAKDAVKLVPLGAKFQALEIELELLAGAGVLAALLDALPESESARERAAIHEGLHG
jgi:tetraacyldisaccharide 4'-kinase